MFGTYGTFTHTTPQRGVKRSPFIRGNDVETSVVREALFYKTVRHPNIMRAHRMRVRAAALDIEMPAGVPLTVYMNAPGADLRAVACDVVCALEFMHQHHMAHGDLKPDNIIIDARGRARLIDFGTVLWRHEHAGYALSRTTFSMVPPEYAILELAGPAADMWAFGLILLRMWTGRWSLRFDTVSDAAAWFTRNRAVPHDLRGVPADIVDIIRRLLVWHPNARMTASEVRTALKCTARAGSVRAVPRRTADVAHAILRRIGRSDATATIVARAVARCVFVPNMYVGIRDIARVAGMAPTRRCRRRIAHMICDMVRNLS